MEVEMAAPPMWRGLIHQYKAHLPVDDNTKIITLHEGNTPLIHAPRLAAEIAPDIELWLKFEGRQSDRQLQRSRHDDGRYQSRRG